jgi:hypothetical protein
VGGLVLGAIGTLSIPATYLLLRRMLDDDEAAFCGTSFLALCPGFILFFPMFDPAYIMLSAAMIGLWYSALRDDRVMSAVLMGAVLAITSIITFNVLVIGLFMAGLIFVAPTGLSTSAKMRRAAKYGSIAISTCAALLVLGWITLGYDPIATFKSAWETQHGLLKQYGSQRQYPGTIPFDLIDFALGSGWVSVPLLIFALTPSPSTLGEGRGEGSSESETSHELRRTPTPALPRSTRGGDKWLILLALLQFFVVAGLGLLQLETARVWNFMLPLLMIPIGLELRRWPPLARLVPYIALVFLTGAICQNLKWIY